MRRKRSATVLVSAICAAVACTNTYADGREGAASIELAPKEKTADVIAASEPELGLKQQDSVFDEASTAEAQERLRAMNRSLEEKERYQLDTRQDVQRYQQENHQLALWYAKALLKGILREFVDERRDSIRHERERSRLQERAQAERDLQKQSRVPAARTPAQVAASEEEPSVAAEILKDVVRFVDTLTDQGVSFALPALSANIRLDTKTTVFETRLQSSIIDMSMNYQVPVAEGATAFGKPIVERVPEQISVSGTRSFQEVGLSAGVNYQVRGQHLSCALAKQVIGPLSAQVERQWDFTDGQQESSTASLNVSMTF